MSQSLARGLALVSALGDRPQTLGELAALLQVHKSTALRLLQTLEADRFVTHDETHHYRLGSRLFDLSSQALHQRDVRTTARPHLEKLNAETGQTVHLAAYESGEVIYIDKLDAVQGVRMYSRVGLRAPLHCTAVAKVLVAGLTQDARDQLTRTIVFEPYTPRTLTNVNDYQAELDLVARQGWAADREEHEAHITCIAVGVLDAVGRTVAALSVSVPEMAMPAADVLALQPLVAATAQAISSDLGYAPRQRPSQPPSTGSVTPET